MKTILIDVPKSSCKDCSYRYQQTIDHNYYGEKTVTERCRLFNKNIVELSPCEECVKMRSDSDQKWIAFSEEVDLILAEDFNKAVDQFVGYLSLKFDGVIGAAAMSIVRAAAKELKEKSNVCRS